MGAFIIYTVKELKEELKPIGKMNIFNMGKEIKKLQEVLYDDEKIVKCCTGVKGIVIFLLVLTESRLITIKKQVFKNPTHNIYEREHITDFFAERIQNVDYINFKYLGESIKIVITRESNSEEFALFAEELFGNTTELYINRAKESRNSPKLYIEILNGKTELGYNGRLFQIIQDNAGEIRFKVDYKLTDDVFYLAGYERTENIQKSALDTAGWTVIGSTWGTAGAIAGAAAYKGKDKSTATLFLVSKETNEKILLVIKCDQKTLGKLSLFIPSQNDFAKPTFDKSALVQLKELLDEGIISQDDYEAKKKQILGL